MEIPRLIDLFQQRKEEREERLRDFFDPAGSTPFLVCPRVENKVFTSCRTIPEVVSHNLAYLEASLRLDSADDLPFLEPWIGVGVYAAAFGSEYYWETGNAPCTRTRYTSIQEIEDLPYPDWRETPIMLMVLQAIDALQEATRGSVPICLTDTQSAQDTATLILDTSEFLTGLYTAPEVIHSFLRLINRLIIEFSRVQVSRIGEGLAAAPGHGFHGLTFLKGIAVSDDNIVFSSPELNRAFSFPCHVELASEFGGLSLHSCGNWTSTMKYVNEIEGLSMIDLALVGHDTDFAPCPGTAVKEATFGKQLILKVRIGSDLDQSLREIRDLYDPAHKLIVEFASNGSDDAERYRRIADALSALYAGKRS